MTSHLDEGQIQELIDGEIPSSALPPIQAHLAACAECRARLDEARTIGSEADRLIETIDPDPPPRQVPYIGPAAPKRWMRAVAWAATVVIAAGVGYLARGTATELSVPDKDARQLMDKPVVSAPATPAPSETAMVVPRPQPLASQKASADRRESGGRAGQPLRESPRDAAANAAPSLALQSVQDELKKSVGKLSQADAESDSLSNAKKERRPAEAPATPLPARVAALPRSDAMGMVASRAKSPEAPVQITLEDALKRLDGSLRLIEGMVPLRIEAVGTEVRVVYPLGSGVLLLTEVMEKGKLVYRLVAPPGFPADSLERLRARVRE